MTTYVSTKQLRRTLCMTTALAGGVLLIAAPGGAQTIPTGPSFPAGQTDPTIGAPVVNGGGGLDLGIQTNANRSIINWSTFNIGANDSVNYTNGATAAGDRVAILNRVIGPGGNNPGPSTISGALTSSSNISVYLLNPTGILFGAGATVNVGGLVASTLDISDADFLDGNDSFAFGASAFGSGGIGTLDTAAINGGEIVAFIGHFVNVAAGSSVGATTAPENAVFVAASEVSMTASPGSPLALTISEGTAVPNAMVLGGTVNGQNVYVGMASQSGVVDSVLSISGVVTATTATATDRGIVLAAGTSASGIAIDAGGDTTGNAKVSISGSLTADDGGTAANNASVEIRALDAITATGPILADDQITLASTRGSVNANGAVTSNGGNVTLATSAGDINIAATGAVNATGGTILLDANGAIDAAAGAVLTASNIDLRAQDFRGAIFDAAVLQEANNLAVTDKLGGLGLVSLSAANRLDIDVLGGGGLTVTDTLTAGGIVDLSAAAITFDGVTVSGSSVIVGGPLTLTGAGSTVSAGGAGTVLFGGTIDGGQSLGVTANGGTTFTGAVGGTTALTSLTVTGPTEINGGAVTTTAAQSFSGLVTLGADTTLAGGDVSFGGAIAGGSNDLVVNAAGTATFTGAVTADALGVDANSVTFGATNAINTLAADIATGGIAFTNTPSLAIGTVGAIAGVTAAAGNVVIASGGGITLTQGVSASAGNVDLAANGGTLTGSGVVSGNEVALLGSAGIGAAGARVNTAATALAADGGTGGVFLSETNAVTLRDVGARTNSSAGTYDLVAGGALTIEGIVTSTGGNASLATTAGDINVAATGRVNAVSGTISLNAAGAIDATAGAVLTGNDIALRAQNFTGAIFTAAVLQEGNNLSVTDTLGGLQVDSLSAANRLDIDVLGGGGLIVTDTPAAGGVVDLQAAAITFDGVAVSGSSVIVGGPLTLTTAGSTVSAGGGAGTILFSGTIDGGQTLGVTANGGTTFAGAVGGTTALTSLTVTGPSAINGGAVTTTAAQSYSGLVTLGADTVLTGGSGTLGGGVAGNDNDLTITFGGTTTLAGGIAGVEDLLTNGNGTTSLNGNITTTGTQNYDENVTLAGNTQLTSSGNAAIRFGGTVNGGSALAVTTSGLTTFTAAVGGTTALTSLATNGSGTTVLNGGVTTSGAQTYSDDVALGSAVTLTAGGAAPISLQGVTGANALTVNTAGQTSFNGAVSIASLATDAPGTTNINTAAIATTGDQTYGDNVVLGTSTTLSGANLSFASISGSGNDLTLNFSGTTALTGPTVLGVRNLTSGGGGTTSLAGTITTTGFQRYIDAVSLAGNTVLNGTDGTFEGAIAGNGNDLDLMFTGLTDIRAGATGLDTLASLGGGTTQLAGTISTSGSQTYNDAVTLASTVTAVSTGNDIIDFQSTLDGAGGLTVNTGGLTRFNGTVGGTTALASLTTNVGGTTRINGGAVRTTGDQSYGDTVELGATTVFTGTNGTFNVIDALAPDIDLTLRFSGVTTLNQAPTDIDDLVSDGGGTTNLNGVILTTGAQTYADAVTLGSTVTLTSSGNAAIMLQGTVNGAQDLTVTTGGLTTFGGLVGGTTALNRLTTNGLGVTAINGGGVTTALEQTYSDAVTIGAAATLTSTDDAAIAFGSTIDGPGALTVTTGGLTSVAGAVGGTTALSALTTNGGGTTALNGGFARTTGAQTYEDAVTSDNDIALRAGSVDALSLTAADDIVIRADTLAEVGTLTSGANPDTDGGTGTGDALAGANLLGNDIDVVAGSVDFGTAIANENGAGSDVGVQATLGDVTIATATAGRDISVRADTGSVDITSADGTDIAIQAAGAISAGTIAARDDIVLGAGTSIATGALTATGSAEDGGSGVGDAGAGGGFDLTSGGNILAAASNGAIATGAISGDVDVALAASMGVTTLDATTGDDLVIRAGGAVSTGDLTTGTDAAVQEGAGDPLVGDNDLDGNDIDVAGTSIAVNAVRANGAGSDVRLRGPVEGSGPDLDIRTGGEIVIDGLIQARDVALQADGRISAVGGIRARDDIAIRAGTTVATGDLASGVVVGGAAPVDTDTLPPATGEAAEAGAADNLLGGRIVGNDIDVGGTGITISRADTNSSDADPDRIGRQSDLRLLASAGQITLGAGTIGGAATLTKQGATGELQVTGTLAAGQAGSPDPMQPAGDVAIASATNARLGTISSGTGSIAVTAVGEATGVGAGAATLLAPGIITDAGEVVDGRDVTVTAGTLARLGTVSAGRNVTVDADAIAIGDGTAANGALRLTADAGTLTASGDLLASGNLDLSATGDLSIQNARSLFGNASATSINGSTIGLSLRARGDATETAADCACIDSVLGGDVPPGAIPPPRYGAPIPDPMRGGGDVVIDAGRIQKGSLFAGRDIALNARVGTISVVTATAGDDLAFRAVGAATIGTVQTGGVDQNGAADALAATTLTGNEVDGQAASIALTTANVGLSTPDATGVQSDLRLRATAGGLTLGTGTVGGRALLDKGGTTGELQVTTLRTGRATGAVGDANLVSATSVRAGTVEAAGGTIDIRAGEQVNTVAVAGDGAIAVASIAARDGAVTGLAGSSNGVAPTFGRAILRADAATGAAAGSNSDRSVSVTAGGLVQLGEVRAGETVTVAAGTASIADRDGAIDIASATASRAALSLTAFNNDPARLAGIRLGTSDSGGVPATDLAPAESFAGTTANLETSGTRGDVVVGRSLRAGGTADLVAPSVRLVSVGDVLLAAAPFEIRALRGDIVVAAADDVTGLPAGGSDTGQALVAGGGLRARNIVAGGDVTIEGAGNVRLQEARSQDGDIVATAGGSVTGLATGDGGDEIDGAGRLFAGRDVNVTAGPTGGETALVRISALAAGTTDDGVTASSTGGNAGITGDIVAIGSARARSGADRAGNLSVVARGGGLHLGNVTLGGLDAGVNGTVTLRTQTAGTLTTPTPSDIGNPANISDILDVDHGAANFWAQGLNQAVTVTAGTQTPGVAPFGVAQLGSVRAGAGGAANAGLDQVQVTADRLTIGSATALEGNLSLIAREGPLYLGTGSAGANALLEKRGAADFAGNELRVRNMLTTGVASPAAGNATIVSATDARLNQVTAFGGSITAAAGADLLGGVPSVVREGDVTGLAGNGANASDAAFTRVRLDAGLDAIVRAGSLVQLGAVTANRNIDFTAGIPTTNGAIDIIDATARTGSLVLSARAAATADPARDGDVILVNGAVGTTARIENADRGGTTGDILIGVLQSGQNAGALDASGRSATIRSANNVRADFVGTRGGPVDVRAGVDASGAGARDGQVTGRAGASNGLAPTFNRGNLVADQTGFAPIPGDQSINVEAGGLVQLGTALAEDNVRIAAGSAGVAARDGAIDVTFVTSERGSVTLTAFNDSSDPARPADIRLGTSNLGGVPSTDGATTFSSSAGTDAVLTTQGTRGDIVIGRSLSAGENAALTSARDVLLAPAPFEVRATRGDLAVAAARDVTGLPAGGNDTGEAFVPGSGLRAGTLSVGGDLGVEAAGNVRLRDATSSEDINVTAGGSVTGLAATDSGDPISLAGRLFAGRDLSISAGPLVRVSEAAAGTTNNGANATATGGNLTVTGDMVAIGSATARAGAPAPALSRPGNMTLTARGTGLHLGTARADGAATLRVQSAGMLTTPTAGDLGSVDATNNDILDAAHGAANLTASAANRTITVTAGTQTPGVAPLGVAQLGNVTAGAGTGQLAAPQVSVTADRLTATNITAANGALVLAAREGPLYLGTGMVGTPARLDKQGAADFAGNELRVRGSLTTGTATGAVGDATLISATDARLGTIEARGGAIDIRAGADSSGAAVRDGDVTGLAVATPITAVGLASGFDRATLTAAGAIAVRAGGLVQAGAIAAGTNILVEAGSAGIADRDGAIDISSAVAATGALSLSAYNDDAAKVADIRLGTIAGADGAATDADAADSDAGTIASLATTGGRGDVVVGRSLRAGGTVTIDGTRDVRFAPAPFEVRSRGGDIAVTAVGNVTGLVAGGTGTGAAVVNGGELRAETLTSGGDLAIDAAGNVRLGSATSTGGSVTVGADGSVTGLAADPAAVTGAGRLFASRNVTVTAGPVARISEIAAGTVDTGATASATGGDIAVSGDLVAIESARARSGSEREGDIALTSRGSGLHLGTGQADGTLALSTGAAGTLATPTTGNLGGPDDPTRDVLDTAYGAADIAAATSATVTAGRETPSATPLGIAQLGTVSAGTDATVTADRLTVAEIAAGGALALTTREGPLFVGTGSAGTSAILLKSGGGLAFTGDELRVRDSLVAGTDLTIRSATDARLGAVTATAGTVQVRAGADATGVAVRTGEVTGLAVSSPIVAAGLSTSHGRAALTGGGSVDVEAGGLVQLGVVQAGQNVRVEAGSEAVAERDGAIDITSAAAANGSLTLRAYNNDAGRVAGVRLGTTDASGTAQADAAAADSLAGTRIELRTLGTRGDVAVGQSLTANGAVGSGDITLGSVADVRLASASDTAADADPEGVRSLNDDVAINAAGSVTGLVAGGTGIGQAAAGELRAGTVTGAGDVVIEGAGNIRLRDVASRAEDISVTAGGSVTGLASGDTVDAISGAGRLFAGRDVRVTAGDTARVTRIVSGRNSDVTATTIATGRTNAGGNVALTAGGTGLHVGTSEAGGTTTIRARTAGTLATPSAGDLGSATGATIDTLATTHGFANLDAQAAGKTVAVTAGTDTPATGSLGVAQIGTVNAGAGNGAAAGVNQIAVTADRLSISSATADNGAIVLTSREGALFVGTGSAGTSATLTKNGAADELRVRNSLTAGTASGAIGNVGIVTATDARLANVTGRNGSIDVTATRDVTGIRLAANATGRGGELGFGAANLSTGGGSAGLDVNVTAGELAQAGTVAAGRTVNIASNSIELTGAMTAPEVNLTNRPARSNSTRLGGTDTGNDNRTGLYVLREEEVNRISADRVNVDSGAQNVEVQNLALNANAGRTNLRVLTTGRADVTGTVTAAGSPTTRTIQIGGTRAAANPQNAATLASVIAVTPGSTGGGRLLAGSANLDLRAGFIGVGLSGFLSEIGLNPGGAPLSNDVINNQFVSNPSSTLYVAGLGVPYQDKVFLTANNLSVSYTNYALFQNSVESVSGLMPTGVEIGGLNVAPALSLGSSGDTAPNGFALFGVINGQSGNQAALLGPNAIPLTNVNRSNSRINGCLVGSGGGGCLVSAVGTPPLNEFDESAANILQTAENLEDRFDPIVGTNNEALFTGISSIDELVEPEVDCEGDPDNPQCAAARPDPAAQQDTNTP